jgi:hypothetical protein
MSRPPQNSSAKPGSADQPSRTKRQFDDAINRIVMDTARRVAEHEAETGNIEESFSRKSFLTPLVNRARESLAKRNAWERSESSWTQVRRETRRFRGWSNWKPPVAGAPTTETTGWSSELRLLAAPVVFGAVVLLLAPLWIRLRPKLAAYFQAAATLASLRTAKIDSPGELVQALDRFLLAQFGLSAAWWHCRTVERELRTLRPDISEEVSRLATVYELSRYGPDSTAIDAARLEQAAQTLRRLAAGPAADESAFSAAPA